MHARAQDLLGFGGARQVLSGFAEIGLHGVGRAWGAQVTFSSCPQVRVHPARIEDPTRVQPLLQLLVKARSGTANA
jgi:hypothetical protein